MTNQTQTEFTPCVAKAVLEIKPRPLVKCSAFQKQKQEVLASYSFPADCGVVLQEVEKSDPQLRLFVSKDEVCVCFYGFPTMPGAGGRDLADEIQVIVRLPL